MLKLEVNISVTNSNLYFELTKNVTFQDSSTEKQKYESVIPCVFGDIGKLENKANEWFERSGQCLKDQPSFHCMLNSIVSRLVNEYRAIFAIEVEFSRSFEK